MKTETVRATVEVIPTLLAQAIIEAGGALTLHRSSIDQLGDKGFCITMTRQSDDDNADLADSVLLQIKAVQ